MRGKIERHGADVALLGRDALRPEVRAPGNVHDGPPGSAPALVPAGRLAGGTAARWCCFLQHDFVVLDAREMLAEQPLTPLSKAPAGTRNTFLT